MCDGGGWVELIDDQNDLDSSLSPRVSAAVTLSGSIDVYQVSSLTGSLSVNTMGHYTDDLYGEMDVNAIKFIDEDLHCIMQVLAPLSLDILQIGGFEDAVRFKLGVDRETLPDAELDQEIVVKLAEEMVKLRVPGWAGFTSTVENLFLRNAVITYICYMLAPTMSSRGFIEVATLDVRWKKDRTNWKALEERFLMEYESLLTNLVGTDSYTVNIVDYSRNTRYPIGTALPTV
jgi:hypothetical protein